MASIPKPNGTSDKDFDKWLKNKSVTASNIIDILFSYYKDDKSSTKKFIDTNLFSLFKRIDSLKDNKDFSSKYSELENLFKTSKRQEGLKMRTLYESKNTKVPEMLPISGVYYYY